MPTYEDIRFGRTCVAMGLVLPQEVDDALAGMAKREENGITEALSEVLMGEGLLTTRQKERVVKALTQQSASTMVGPYELLQKIGEGGMGAVYKANDTRTHKIVAIKVLPRSKGKDQIFVERFEEEARAAFELDHPHIVRGMDLGESDGWHYLVMEYIDGDDLFNLLQKKGRFQEREALQLVEGIAEALVYIHEERHLHRDIKPENILVDQHGVAKLADLGLSIDNRPGVRRRITKTGITMGTPSYLSPEQARGDKEIDIRSDIFALGATLYEMVTGKTPFEGETPAITMMKVINDTVVSPRDIDKSISVNACHVIEKMMGRALGDRYAEPLEVLVDIRLVLAGNQPATTRLPPGKSAVARPYGEQAVEVVPVAAGAPGPGSSSRVPKEPAKPKTVPPVQASQLGAGKISDSRHRRAGAANGGGPESSPPKTAVGPRRRSQAADSAVGAAADPDQAPRAALFPALHAVFRTLGITPRDLWLFGAVVAVSMVVSTMVILYLVH
ncbi:MAG TPA: serine/threonine-protein kinase [Planctomycetota bacterium]|nr:serine/threonine-protein kinase [Planctomycetota bacterium]